MSSQKEYYGQYNTGKTEQIIAEANEIINTIIQDGGRITPDYLMGIASRIALQNVNKDGTGRVNFNNIEGGPFAAVLVRYEGGLDESGNGIGKPIIIGIGANHVVPEHDPSAHGEMSCLRDATARQGFSDLNETVMFTSCECCPQCQASITAHGIKKVFFANDRDQAAAIQFSDEEQYRHIETMDDWMSKVDNLKNKDALLQALGEHGAVILDKEGKVIAYGDVNLDSSDALESLPSMNAIRAACKEKQGFHLPEGCTIVTKNRIHPISFTTADWARIGRDRDPKNPNDPSKDAFPKDQTKIVYVNDDSEQVILRDANGDQRSIDAAKILEDVNTTPQQRELVKTERLTNPRTLRAAGEAFKTWDELIHNDGRARY